MCGDPRDRLRRRVRLSHPGGAARRAPVGVERGRIIPRGTALPRRLRDVSSDGDDVPERVSGYRRIAVFGGVYSNAPALRAMLEDARAREVEAVFCLGDVGGFGPHPDGVYPLLREAGVHMVRGNDDEAPASGRGGRGRGYTY